MATKGGRRPGAGRKAGSVTKKSRAAAETIAASGDKTPLQVLIDCMHKAVDANDDRAAANYASLAAPYVHARLSAVTSTNTHQVSFPTMVDEFSA